MRIVFASLVILMFGAAFDAPGADPYRWCAAYGGGGDDGGTNCYFVTIEQCRAAVSGVGGHCVPNNFYDGRPVTTPGEAYPRGRKRPSR